MAEHNPVRINRTGDTGKVQAFIPGTDTISADFLTDTSVTNRKLATDSVTRDKMANLSVGPRELISQAVDHGNIGLDSIGVENLVIGSRTQTEGFVLTVGTSTSIADASQESGRNVAIAINAVDPATIGGGGGITEAGFGLNIPATPGDRVELNYADPEMIFTLSKQASDKTFFRTNGVLSTISFDLPPANGIATSGTNPVVPYQQDFNRSSTGALESIVISLVNADLSLTEVARKTFNRNADGSLRNIVIS